MDEAELDLLDRLDCAYDRWWGTDDRDPEPVSERDLAYLGLLLRVARGEIRQLRERLGVHPHHSPGGVNIG